MPHRHGSTHAGRRVSLRTRLTFWVVAMFGVLQLVTAAMFWFYQREAIASVFYERLQERAGSIAANIEPRLASLTDKDLRALARAELGYIQFERYRVDVIDRMGFSLVSGMPTWPKTAAEINWAMPLANEPGSIKVLDSVPDFSEDDRRQARIVMVPLKVGGRTSVALIVATTDDFVDQKMALVTHVLGLAGAFGLLSSAVSGWLIAGIAVAPIKRLASVAEQLRPETMDRKLDLENPSAEVAELTAELDAARARMVEAFAAQERFLSNVSHELKTPIATLLLEAQTLDRTNLPQAASAFLDSAEDEMRKLGRLVESFLTLTRVKGGQNLTNARSYPANELVMDALEDCLSMARQYDVTLKPSLAEGDYALDACVVGDPELLRTLLNNLIRNAIRFSPQPGEIAIIATIQDETYRIAVQDQGPGLPPEILDRIFDRFVQSSDEVRRHRGHGLGLAIAKGIAELHQGDIHVRNLPEGGAEFAVVLPVYIPCPDDDDLPENGPAAACEQAEADLRDT